MTAALRQPPSQRPVAPRWASRHARGNQKHDAQDRQNAAFRAGRREIPIAEPTENDELPDGVQRQRQRNDRAARRHPDVEVR